MELAVETHGLTRTFGDFRAVDAIDLVALERVYPDRELRWRATFRRL